MVTPASLPPLLTSPVSMPLPPRHVVADLHRPHVAAAENLSRCWSSEPPMSEPPMVTLSSFAVRADFAGVAAGCRRARRGRSSPRRCRRSAADVAGRRTAAAEERAADGHAAEAAPLDPPRAELRTAHEVAPDLHRPNRAVRDDAPLLAPVPPISEPPMVTAPISPVLVIRPALALPPPSRLWPIWRP